MSTEGEGRHYKPGSVLTIHGACQHPRPACPRLQDREKEMSAVFADRSEGVSSTQRTHGSSCSSHAAAGLGAQAELTPGEGDTSKHRSCYYVRNAEKSTQSQKRQSMSVWPLQ